MAHFSRNKSICHSVCFSVNFQNGSMPMQLMPLIKTQQTKHKSACLIWWLREYFDFWFKKENHSSSSTVFERIQYLSIIFHSLALIPWFTFLIFIAYECNDQELSQYESPSEETWLLFYISVWCNIPFFTHTGHIKSNDSNRFLCLYDQSKSSKNWICFIYAFCCQLENNVLFLYAI